MNSRNKFRSIPSNKTPEGKKQSSGQPQTPETNLDQFHRRSYLEEKHEVTQLHTCNPKKNKKIKATNSRNEFRSILSKQTPGGKKQSGGQKTPGRKEQSGSQVQPKKNKKKQKPRTPATNLDLFYRRRLNSISAIQKRTRKQKPRIPEMNLDLFYQRSI
ncbi:6076_t:CDS:2 [Gigaspora rosea]|nr:6076_t:CDS:2 [Gigaspora rosea]